MKMEEQKKEPKEQGEEEQARRRGEGGAAEKEGKIPKRGEAGRGKGRKERRGGVWLPVKRSLCFQFNFRVSLCLVRALPAGPSIGPSSAPPCRVSRYPTRWPSSARDAHPRGEARPPSKAEGKHKREAVPGGSP